MTITHIRKAAKKSRKAAQSASPRMSNAAKTGVKKDIEAWARLEQIAEDPKKPIKTRQSALTKLGGIQRRWDAALSKAGR